MQFGTLQNIFRFASTAVKGKKAVKSGSGASAAGSKAQPTTNISKMPQPHPVLTPITRSGPLVSDPILPIEKLFTSDKTAFRIELEGELQKRLPKTISELAEHFNGNFFVARKKLISEITTVMAESSKVLLNGPNGSGKSILLLQLYASFKESIKSDAKKLSVYLPNAQKWTTGYFPYYPIECDGRVEFKQPELALEILHLISICNQNKVPVGLSAEIAEAQLDTYNRALPLYERVMAQFAEQGQEITMFLDGVNGLVDENSLTGYLDPEGKPLMLKALPLCAKVFTMKNVKTVGALTESNPSLPKLFQIPDGFKTVTIPNYSSDDLKQVLQLYNHLGHTSSNKSDQFIEFKAFVSGSNGRKLYKTCEYDSIYYKN